jgi:hypothetical protein
MGVPGLAAVVVGQGVLSGLAGALPGSIVGAVVVRAIRRRGLEAVLTPDLIVLTVVASVLTCALAAATSVARVRRLEAALVFRT